MVKISISHDFPLALSDCPAESPRPWKGRKIIHIPSYHFLLGFVLYLFGKAVKFQTPDQKTVYLNKHSLLKTISKNSDECNRLFAEMYCNQSTIKQEEFIAKVNTLHRGIKENFLKINDNTLNQIKSLQEQKELWEGVEEDIQTMTSDPHKSIERLQFKIARLRQISKHEQLGDFEQNLQKDKQTFMREKKGFIAQELKNAETNYFQSLNQIKDTLTALSNYPKVIESLSISDLSMLRNLSSAFLEIEQPIFQIVLSKPFMNRLHALSHEYEEMKYDKIVDQLKNEDQLLGVLTFLHTNISIKLKKQAKFKKRDDDCLALIEKSISRVIALKSKLNPSTISALMTSDFATQYPRVANALKNTA